MRAISVPDSVEARVTSIEPSNADIRFRVPMASEVAGIRIGSLILSTSPRGPKTESGVFNVRVGGDVESLGTEGSNRLEDGSFERSLWNANYTGMTPPHGLAARVSKDATDGNRSLELVSRGGRVATSRALENFNPSDLYKISFSYKHVAGESPAFAVWETVTKRIAAEGSLSDTPGWHHFETIVDPSPAAGGLHLYLYSNAATGGRTVNRFDNAEALKMVVVARESLNALFASEKQLSSIALGQDGVLMLETPRGCYGLVEDGSFERSLWNGANYTGMAPPQGLAARVSKDATDGNRSLELVSRGGRVATSRALENFDPSDLYKISFSYKHVAGEIPAFAVWETVTERIAAEGSLSDTPGWHHFETIVDPSPAAGGLHLYLYSNAATGGRTVNRFDNVEASSVPKPTQLLLEADTQSEATRDPEVEIDSTEDTSIRGLLHGVRGAAWIVLPQSFHPDWDLRAYSHTGERLAILEHVRVNAFANAWLVEGNGTVAFEVEYETHQTQLIGFAVSAAGLAMGLLLLVWRRLTRRRTTPSAPVLFPPDRWWPFTRAARRKGELW